LYGFADRVARRVSDTRRQQFLREMLVGLVVGGHVHLSKIARAAGCGFTNVHAAEKRLSRHLKSPHWDTATLSKLLLSWSAEMVQEDSLIVADLTEVTKCYSRHLEGLGRVRDAREAKERIVPGYVLWEAYVRVGRWQLFPLVIEPLRTYSGAASSENAEILRHWQRIMRVTEGRGTWVLDRGFDRRELLEPMLKWQMAFVVRQRGDRHIVTRDGREVSVRQRAQEVEEQGGAQPWPSRGWVYSEPVFLPELPEEELLLVVFWRVVHHEPLMLLVSPRARRAGRTGWWYVQAYRRRWGVEDANRGIKQRFHLEHFLVRSWRSLCRLICLVALAFFWLNLWGEEEYARLREAFLHHPWRLPKTVTYLFDWLATQIGLFLHPKPKFLANGYFDTG
jgi:hypothetical protein